MLFCATRKYRYKLKILEGDRAVEMLKAFVKSYQTDDESCVHTVVRGSYAAPDEWTETQDYGIATVYWLSRAVLINERPFDAKRAELVSS